MKERRYQDVISNAKQATDCLCQVRRAPEKIEKAIGYLQFVQREAAKCGGAE